jgi:hypothetical protein
VEVMHLDLSELKSVRQFAEEFKQKNLPLNILMYVINLLFSSVLFLV